MNVNERKLSFVCLRYVNSFSKRATLEFTHKKERNVCCTTRSQIKSEGNSLIKKKERYAVPEVGQTNLYGNSLIKFAR